MESLGCHAKELGLDVERNGKPDFLEPSCLPHAPLLALLSGEPPLPLASTCTAGCLSHHGGEH